MSSPTFFPEGSVPHAGDNIARQLIKLNGRLYDMVMATLSWLGPAESNCAPHAQDNPQRSLTKINALIAAVEASMAGTGTASPEGVVTGTREGQYYVQTDANDSRIERVWYFNGVVGTNTGWI